MPEQERQIEYDKIAASCILPVKDKRVVSGRGFDAIRHERRLMTV